MFKHLIRSIGLKRVLSYVGMPVLAEFVGAAVRKLDTDARFRLAKQAEAFALRLREGDTDGAAEIAEQVVGEVRL